MSRGLKIGLGVAALLLVAGGVVAAALQFSGGGPEIETAQATEVNLGVSVNASGKIEEGLSADLYPPTAGTLAAVYVTEGADVFAGDKVAMMDQAPLEAQVEQARSALAQAEAQLDTVDDQAPSSADIAAAEANVTASKAALDAACAQLDAVDDQAPSSADKKAAESAVVAAQTAYDNANAAYKAAQKAYQAQPSPDTYAAMLQAETAKDQAYAALQSAKAQRDQLVSTDLSPARAQAEAGVEQARAAYDGAVAQLDKLRSTSVSAQAAAAQSGVDAAAAQLALAESNLKNSTFIAPIDGVVFFNASGQPDLAGSAPQPEPGAAVSPQVAPFSVVDLDGSVFVAEVDEADIERVEPGMLAAVRLDAIPSDEISTTVVRVQRSARQTPTGGTVFPVDLALVDTGFELLIGMKGDVEIEVESVPSAVVVPIEALFEEGGESYVFVVEDNVLDRTVIEVGAATETDIQVLSGLEAGAEVALSGPTEYEDGMSVSVKE